MIKTITKVTIIAAITSIFFTNTSKATNDYKIISGTAKQGGFVVLQIPKQAKIEYKKVKIKADQQGRVLIAFSRDDKAKQTFKLTTSNGKNSQQTIKIATRKYNEQKINGLPKNKVTPDKKTSEKIWQDILKARKARKITLPKAYFTSGFSWPATGIISGVYGSRRILNGKAKRPHYGVDVAAPKGAGLYAPADGKITLNENMELSGKTVMIDHGYGLRSTVMHLSEVMIKKGQLVKKGQLIGKVGMTGRATGPHVHWGMSWYKVRLDPALAIRAVTKPGDKVSSPNI